MDIEVPEAIVRRFGNPKHIVCFELENSSVGLQAGDLVFVDTSDKSLGMVAMYDDERRVVLRTVEKIPEGFRVYRVNPKLPPEDVWAVDIIGKFVGVLREI